MRKKFPKNGIMKLIDEEFTRALELDSSIFFLLSRKYMDDSKPILITGDYYKIKNQAELRMKDKSYVEEAKKLAKEQGISMSVDEIFNQVIELGDTLTEIEKKEMGKMIAEVAILVPAVGESY